MITSEKKLITVLWILVYTPIFLGFILPTQTTFKIALASLFAVLLVVILLVRIRKKEHRPLIDTKHIKPFLLGIALALLMTWLMNRFYFLPQANKIIQEHLQK